MNKTFLVFLLTCGLAALGGLGSAAFIAAQQVERERPVQQTTIGIERGKTVDNVQLHVVDTANACIYIVHDANPGSTGSAAVHTIGVTAIAKKQMLGASCQ